MTPAVTSIGRELRTVERIANQKPRITEVDFRTDEAQLLGLWTATRLLGEVRGLAQRGNQAELLSKAQILLTAFVLGLEPLGPDQASSASPRADLGRVVRFDA
jgi:hypothetical protein